MKPRIAIAPDGPHRWAIDAIVAGGGEVTALDEAEALLWVQPTGADALWATVERAPQLVWVQTPFAGIEPLVDAMDDGRTWTCGKRIYAEPVAEHALTLALAGMRGLGTYARATEWSQPIGTNLLDASVVVLGAGGIAEAFLTLLAPFECRVTVVRRRPDDAVAPGSALADVDRVVAAGRLLEVLPEADLVVVALALTPETHHIISTAELDAMRDTAWLVNVARGGHVDTEALVHALAYGRIGGAGLDVTDPEPLPPGHPLWALDNCLITPHIGNTPEMGRPLLIRHVTENVRRFAAGEELLGLVDLGAGY